MTYRVLCGEAIADVRDVRTEQAEGFATESQALCRARELLDEDERHPVAVCDGDGNVLGGVRLQLKVGHHGE